MLEFTLIFPAFNEAATIENTVREAVAYLERKHLSFEIIVSADGTDGTREIVHQLAAKDPRLSVIGSDERNGKGHGVRQAVAAAGGQIIGFADADNKVPINELDNFLPLISDACPVVIGSRALSASRIERRQPWYRRIGSRAFTVFLHAIVGVFATDTQCGFKFFTHEAAKAIFGLQRINGYMFDVELLAIAGMLGYEVREVPVRWRDDGDSRLRLFSGNVQNGIDLFRIRWYLSTARADLWGAKALVEKAPE